MKAVGWVLVGDEKVPSSRIHGLNLHEQLVKAGVRSVILRKSRRYNEFLHERECHQILEACRSQDVGILILQKMNGPEAYRLAVAARAKGLRVVAFVCDVINNDLAEVCDCVIVVSTFLKQLFKRSLRHKITVLDDAIELPDRYRCESITIPAHDRLKAVYLASAFPDKHILGMLGLCSEFVDVTIVSAPRFSTERDKVSLPPPPRETSDGACDTTHLGQGERAFDGNVQHVGHYQKPTLFGWIAMHGLDCLPRAVRVVQYGYRTWSADRQFAKYDTNRILFREWKLATVFDVLAEHHVGLIPAVLNSNFRMGKSVNRLATFLGMGLATIASPVPAYREHARGDDRVLFADSAGSWRRQLRKLTEDRSFAGAIAAAGHAYAWERFALLTISKQLRSILQV